MLEILVVVALIAIVAAVAIPMLKRGETVANEAAAVKALRVLASAQMQYYMTYKTYGTLEELGPRGKRYLGDVALTQGVRDGYRFVLVIGEETGWYALALPMRYGETGQYSFYIDETQTLRHADPGKAELVERAVAMQWNVMP
jgi:type II secretory pathway pseudopilin PulG